MDSFEFNKFFGAATGALMVYFAVSFAIEGIYGGGHGGHGDHEQLAFAMAIDESHDEPTGGDDAAPKVPLASLLADADAGAGERVFRKCGACHTAEAGGVHKVGPALHGVLGRQVANAAGYDKYSDAMAGHGGVWDWELLDAFITSPSDVVPGTKMNFRGIASAEDRADLLVFLNQASGSPIAPPEPPAEAEAPAEADEPAAAEEPAE